jgi:hypothetical protein
MRKEDSLWKSLENLTKLTNVTADAENAALLTKFIQSAGGARFFLSGLLARKPNKDFFIKKKEFIHEQVLNFLHSSTDCSQNSPLHMRQNRPHYRKTLNVDQQFHRK